ncbi:MAG: hypothetical protein GXP31_16200 [Kiritimatiellaeota bacterium]|nr:hypothetical protein [Kiritimatiellota bacterium]
MNIRDFFSEEEKKQIDTAVGEAERRTSAEIVPVLTGASGDYDRAEDMFGLFLAVAAVCACWVLFQGPKAGVWETGQDVALRYGLPWIVATILVAFAVGAVTATKAWFIRHLFTPRSVMLAAVRRGAERAFYEHSLSRTTGGTGVLIYVSVFERMVYVLGDSTISEKLTDADFAEVKDAVVAGFASGRRAEGMCNGIRLCGEKLAAHFPIQEGDVNELPNQLRIYEQRL